MPVINDNTAMESPAVHLDAEQISQELKKATADSIAYGVMHYPRARIALAEEFSCDTRLLWQDSPVEEMSFIEVDPQATKLGFVTDDAEWNGCLRPTSRTVFAIRKQHRHIYISAL